MIGNLVGILGGGQLARMLAESAFRLGLQPRVLTSSPDDPAAQLCGSSVYGDWNEPVALRRFFSQVKTVVFENEFVPCEVLEQASRGLDVKFFPALGTLFQLQDKLRQKEILSRLKIPTSPYEALPKGDDVRAWSRKMVDRFDGGCVFKWAQLGYDGKGTWISPEHWTREAGEQAAEFCENAVKRRVPLYAEKKIAFRRELAVIGCLSVTGEFAAWPLVVSRQSAGICKLVSGPATALGVSPKLETLAHRYARQIAESLGLFGCFGVEMFETPEGELWVNELAPRVHNTGHYTQDASVTSQFENHWRAVLGLPLGHVGSAPGFAMLNLLGPPGVSAEATGLPLPSPSSRAHLHWYGKKELRPGRKLGHLNGRVESAGEITGLVRELENCEQAWADALTSKGTAK